MTVDELILSVSERIRTDIYGANHQHEFYRDRHMIYRAIGMAGHECLEKEWLLSTDLLHNQLMQLMSSIEAHKVGIRYFPAYFACAIKKWMGQHAEEWSVQAKRVEPHCARIVHRTQRVEAIIQPSAVEVLDALYRNLKPKKGKAEGKQMRFRLK